MWRGPLARASFFSFGFDLISSGIAEFPLSVYCVTFWSFLRYMLLL